MKHLVCIIGLLMLPAACGHALPSIADELDLFYNYAKSEDTSKAEAQAEKILTSKYEESDLISAYCDIYDVAKNGSLQDKISKDEKLVKRVLILAKDSKFRKKIFTRYALASDNEADFENFANQAIALRNGGGYFSTKYFPF